MQDDNYATARLAASWTGPPFGVRALLLQADTGWGLSVTGIIGGITRHLSLQFWNGLDPTAFAGFVLTCLALAFRRRRDDDARYGGLHSVLWALAATFVVGRLVAVYLNLYPSSLPWFGDWFVTAAKTGSGLDGWMLVVAKSPLEWAMIVLLVVARIRREPISAATVPEPPTIWHDRFHPSEP